MERRDFERGVQLAIGRIRWKSGGHAICFSRSINSCTFSCRKEKKRNAAFFLDAVARTKKKKSSKSWQVFRFRTRDRVNRAVVIATSREKGVVACREKCNYGRLSTSLGLGSTKRLLRRCQPFKSRLAPLSLPSSRVGKLLVDIDFSRLS